MSAASIQAPAQQWKRYLALTKPRILPMVIVTALPVFGLAAVSAPSAGMAIGVLLGIVLVAAAANTLNMYVERDRDLLAGQRELPEERIESEDEYDQQSIHRDRHVVADHERGTQHAIVEETQAADEQHAQ